MKHNVLFGPAGSPVNYKGAAYKAPKYIQDEGLNSYEYQSPYGVRIGEKAATTLKEESEKHDILISMHAPYYINLCAKEESKLDKSIGHLIAAARAGEWMGAYRLVFHPGAYLNRKPEKAMENAIDFILKAIHITFINSNFFWIPIRNNLICIIKGECNCKPISPSKGMSKFLPEIVVKMSHALFRLKIWAPLKFSV